MTTPDPRDAARVMTLYTACIDTRDFERFRGCFVPDVELVGFGPDLHGVDDWIRFVETTLAPYAATQHLIGPPLVDEEPDGVALRTELQAQHWYREPRGKLFTLWGSYRTNVTWHEDAWRIRRHALEVRATEVRMLQRDSP